MIISIKIGNLYQAKFVEKKGMMIVGLHFPSMQLSQLGYHHLMIQLLSVVIEYLVQFLLISWSCYHSMSLLTNHPIYMFNIWIIKNQLKMNLPLDGKCIGSFYQISPMKGEIISLFTNQLKEQNNVTHFQIMDTIKTHIYCSR